MIYNLATYGCPLSIGYRSEWGGGDQIGPMIGTSYTNRKIHLLCLKAIELINKGLERRLGIIYQ